MFRLDCLHCSNGVQLSNYEITRWLGYQIVYEVRENNKHIRWVECLYLRNFHDVGKNKKMNYNLHINNI
jgi:hypothetical protein